MHVPVVGAVLLLLAVGAAFAFNGDCPTRPAEWRQLLGKRRCKKACISHTDCKKRNKRCLCDGECGLSCLNPASLCHALRDVPNGFVRAPSDFVVGSNAEYGCDDGYVLIGPSQRRCQGNREWSGAQPVCRIRAKCGQPPEIPYARHDGDPNANYYDIESMVQYTCIAGYHRFNNKGLPKAKCLLDKGVMAQWFGPDLKCKARNCGNPGDILNGIREVGPGGELFEYPHLVKFRCIPGFELIGSAVRKCQADGRWSGDTPTCKPTQCPRPPDPMHGRVLGTSLSYQSRVTYNCRDGFRLVGQVQRICQADGSWGGTEPLCEEIRCSSIGPLWNGYIEGDDTHFGAIVVFRCLEKMSQVGPPYARCLDDATWSHPMPKCFAPCVVPTIEKGHVWHWNQSQQVLHGERIQIKCDAKHELEFPENPLCNNGTWSHVPRCVPVRCKSWPPRVSNARVVFAKATHDSVARYECKPGFHLTRGDPIIRCLFGEWKREGDSEPQCEEKFCRHPTRTPIGTLRNGAIKLESFMGAFDFSEYVRFIGESRRIVYECDKGYYLQGPPKATCVNGHWQPNVAPKCVSQTHPLVEGRIVWDRTKRSIPTPASHPDPQAPSHAPHTVDDGSCPALYDNRRQQLAVIRLNRRADGRFPHGSQLMVLCQQGYELAEGTDGALLCSNASWIPEVPTCKPKFCRLPPRLHSFFLQQAEILQSGAMIRHREGARMVCLRGYELVGNSALECNLGKWLKSAGECEPKSCQLPFIDRGFYALSPLPNQISHGSNVSFVCEAGLNPRPVIGNVLCAFGDLRPHAPECNIEISPNAPTPNLNVGCQRPLETDAVWVYRETRHGGRSIATLIDPYQEVYPSNTVVHYKCTSNTAHTVANAVRCIDGEWIAQLSACAPQDTPPEGVINNATTLPRHQTNPTRQACPQPIHPQRYNLTVLDQHRGVLEAMQRDGFVHGTVLHVVCGQNLNSANQTKWKIRCRKGRWKQIERIVCMQGEMPNSGSCPYTPGDGEGVVAFSPERGDTIQFNDKLDHGQQLLFRCTDVGFYRLKGSRKMVCRNGTWTGKQPSCVRLSPFEADESGPPIVFRVMKEAMAAPDGGEQSLFESYRLAVMMTQPEDAGLFHCVAPSGHRHSIILRVQDVQCPPIPMPTVSALTAQVSSDIFFLGSTVLYHCAPGYQLRGSPKSVCLEPGRWSHRRPSCTPVVCPSISLEHKALSVTISSTEFHGIAEFACAPGYTVVGARQMDCLESGRWSEKPPTCAAVSCPAPDLPKGGGLVGQDSHHTYGAVLESGSKVTMVQNYTYGDVIIFRCEPGYMLTGRDFAVCGLDGRWDSPAADCQPFCRYPGRPENGDSTSKKDYYLIGERIVYYCTGSYRLKGDNVLECTAKANWSTPLPSCVLYGVH
uniref:Sushi domain-containing protein n=1 Tax=Plectus sambesii TaxID=2011161 RepID=A0A914VW63_9BILA